MKFLFGIAVIILSVTLTYADPLPEPQDDLGEEPDVMTKEVAGLQTIFNSADTMGVKTSKADQFDTIKCFTQYVSQTVMQLYA